MIVYLAGAIDDPRLRDAESWRKKSMETLKKVGIQTFSPAHAFKVGREATSLDKNAIIKINELALEKCDVILAEMEFPVNHIGTIMEIQRACTLNKPIVVWSSNSFSSVFLSRKNIKQFQSLDTCLTYIKQIPQKINDQSYINIKCKNGSKAPIKHYPNDAGYDLFVSEDTDIPPREFKNIPTNIYMEIPEGYWALILGRSSTLVKRKLWIPPSVIDNGWRGGMYCGVFNLTNTLIKVKQGERLSQMILFPLINFPINLVTKLSESNRGAKGFGSTGE